MDPTERLAKIEARLAGIEARLDQLENGQRSAGWFGVGLPGAAASESPPRAERKSEEELEFVVGQTWFAHAGILVLAIGAGFALSLPYPGVPPAVPSLAGFVLAGVLFLLARAGTRAFELLSHHLRAAGMALLFFASLRMFYFGATPALTLDSWGGRVLLLQPPIDLGLADFEFGAIGWLYHSRASPQSSGTCLKTSIHCCTPNFAWRLCLS